MPTDHIQAAQAGAGQLDPGTLGDIQAIADGHRLPASQAELLCRYVAGAVRPNRDRPVWDLCWLVIDIGQALRSGAQPTGAGSIEERTIAVLLDSSDNAARLLGLRGANAGVRRRWPPTSLGALLAFADFILTHEDCAWFGQMQQAFAALSRAEPAGAEEAVKSAVQEITRRLRKFRTDHLPLAQYEKQFRSLSQFLGARGRSGADLADLTDADILDYWAEQLTGESRMLYRTAVQQVLTFRSVIADLSAQQAMSRAGSLDDDSRTGLMADQLEAAEAREALVGLEAPAEGEVKDFLQDGAPDDVKMLTGTERERLLDLVDCGDLAGRRPLTVLRYLAFGAVQSGLSNYLRRGGGGADLAERVTCRDAERYPDVLTLYGEMHAHLDRLLLIAAHLAAPSAQAANDDGDAGYDAALLARLTEDGKAALKRLKRKGFSGDRERLTHVLLAVSGHVGSLRGIVSRFIERGGALNRTEPLDTRFEADRTRFSELFQQAYLGTKDPAP